jgi:hypothetical protein
MLKAILALSSALLAMPLLASPTVHHLAGVADSETTIPYGDIRQSVRGHADVLFVKNRDNRWYRLQVNAGCARRITDANTLVFRHNGSGQQIDRFTTIVIPEEGRTCNIRSIRESEAPPQINSRSRVTLD